MVWFGGVVRCSVLWCGVVWYNTVWLCLFVSGEKVSTINNEAQWIYISGKKANEAH